MKINIFNSSTHVASKIGLLLVVLGLSLPGLCQEKNQKTEAKIPMSKIFSYVAIPCTDFERAYKFYEEITGGLIKRNPAVPFPMAYFVDNDYNYVGHLFQLEKLNSSNGTVVSFKPSSDGVIVYMEMATDLNETVEKIGKAGGTIVMPKTLIAPGKGYWALFLDTEGNRIALHSGN